METRKEELSHYSTTLQEAKRKIAEKLPDHQREMDDLVPEDIPPTRSPTPVMDSSKGKEKEGEKQRQEEELAKAVEDRITSLFERKDECIIPEPEGTEGTEKTKTPSPKPPGPGGNGGNGKLPPPPPPPVPGNNMSGNEDKRP